MQLTDATDALSLTRQMIDIPSVSGEEGPLADAVEAALRGAGFGSVDTLEILRDGDAVCARTHLGLPQRVVLEVTETEPAMKGQTASSSYKPAILSNGVRTAVPPHIAVGTRVVIMTEDGSYVERAKD